MDRFEMPASARALGYVDAQCGSRVRCLGWEELRECAGLSSGPDRFAWMSVARCGVPVACRCPHRVERPPLHRDRICPVATPSFRCLLVTADGTAPPILPAAQ